MLRGRALQEGIVYYLLTATVNVTLNAVDFSQPQNDTAVFAEAAQLISNMTAYAPWDTFYWKVMISRFDFFHVSTQMIGTPETALLGVISPPLYGAQERITFAPTLAPTGPRRDPKSLSKSQQIGIGVSLSLLAIFQFIALYFCFVKEDSVKFSFGCFSCFNNSVHVTDSPS